MIFSKKGVIQRALILALVMCACADKLALVEAHLIWVDYDSAGIVCRIRYLHEFSHVKRAI
ncbi:hypothetical protein GCM10008090_23290 [Arenicella chitinivorans]|uniref:Lipoprotein n=1 Tax=Arenicella chitinivorans TaxID=1329800 RepID=A0A918RVH5_9GAMM|nr:hypothetical protein GCM10008090_23290 [Arenicella chitinivorans]